MTDTPHLIVNTTNLGPHEFYISLAGVRSIANANRVLEGCCMVCSVPLRREDDHGWCDICLIGQRVEGETLFINVIRTDVMITGHWVRQNEIAWDR